MKSRKVLISLFVICCIFLVIIIGGLVALNEDKKPTGSGGEILGDSSSKTLTKVTFRPYTLPSIDYAYLIIAQEKGFFAEEGLEVELVPGIASSVPIIQSVGSGADDFGHVGANSVLDAVGKGVPLKVIAVLMDKTAIAELFSANSSIRFPKDLEGKRNAVTPQSTSDQEFAMFAKLNGLDMKSIPTVGVYGGPPKIQAVMTGKADFTTGIYYILKPNFERQGFKVRSMKLADYGVNTIGLSLITNNKMIEERPEIVRGFTRAALRGVEYMVDHPNEAADMVVARYPELNEETIKLQLENFLPFLQHEPGHQSRERWEEMQDIMYTTGSIDKKIDVTTAYTTEFLP